MKKSKVKIDNAAVSDKAWETFVSGVVTERRKKEKATKNIFNGFPDNVALGGVWKWVKGKNIAYTKGEEFKGSKHDQGIEINWSIKGKGFGSIAFYQKSGKLMLDTENESKDFVKKILCALVDKAKIGDQ